MFSDKSEIGYNDMKTAVEDRKNQSMLIAMSYLLSDQDDKEDFLGTYYFTKYIIIMLIMETLISLKNSIYRNMEK